MLIKNILCAKHCVDAELWRGKGTKLRIPRGEAQHFRDGSSIKHQVWESFGGKKAKGELPVRVVCVEQA